MEFQQFTIFITRYRWAFIVLSLLALCGCVTVGPNSVLAGRGAYSEVINKTEDEQLLNAVVRSRYDETFGMLQVAAVTANLRFKAVAGTEIGIGDAENYAGNLVPLSAGVSYEENPTISYVPLSGEDFMRRVMTAVSLEEWHLLSGAGWDKRAVFEMTVFRINGLYNPLLSSNERSPEFERFIEIYELLTLQDVLNIQKAVIDDDENPDYVMALHDYDPANRDNVEELFKLLSIKVKVDGSPILLPIRQGYGNPDDAILIQTRSAQNVFHLLGFGVDVPQEHLEAGIVEPLPLNFQDARKHLTIRSSEKRPENATVLIRYRDRWFYIDATDRRSKRTFLFLRTFAGMRLTEVSMTQRAPIITVPIN